MRWFFKYRYHMPHALTYAKEQALHTEWKKKGFPEYNIFHICSFSWFNDSILWQGIFRLTDQLVRSITIAADLRFVKKFTRPDFRAKNFTHEKFVMQLFLLKEKQHTCIYISYFSSFFIKILTVSIQNHTLSVYIFWF